MYTVRRTRPSQIAVVDFWRTGTFGVKTWHWKYTNVAHRLKTTCTIVEFLLHTFVKLLFRYES